jgi:hypothetical protein
MSNSSLYYLGRLIEGDSSRNLKMLEADIPELQRIGREFSFADFYLYGKDEAKGKELLEGMEARRSVHKLGAKILSAGSKGHFDVVGPLTDILVFHGAPDLDEARKGHSMGRKIYSYHNPQSGPENPALFRTRYGIQLWQAGFDGAMIYAYQHSMGSIWNDFDHATYRDHVLAYPTANGVIDTIAWEGLREGIDDVRYLSTLERMVKEQENNPVMARELRQAVNYLTDLKLTKRIEPLRVRAEVIQLILKLSNIVSRSRTHSLASPSTLSVN